jgi:small GTP-binding protein
MVQEKEITVKLVTIGDGAVGKTSLLMSFAQNKFPEQYIPTVFDNCTTFHIPYPLDNTTLIYETSPVTLSLWDTAGQSDYDTLRPLAYPNTHVFLICFDVMSRTSFFNVNQVWITEMKHHCPDVPFVLCGTKCDMLQNKELIKKLEWENQPPILKKEGEEKAKKLGAYAYVQCSGKTQQGLTEVFTTCVEAALIKQGIIKPKGGGDTQPHKKTSCLLM